MKRFYWKVDMLLLMWILYIFFIFLFFCALGQIIVYTTQCSRSDGTLSSTFQACVSLFIRVWSHEYCLCIDLIFEQYCDESGPGFSQASWPCGTAEGLAGIWSSRDVALVLPYQHREACQLCQWPKLLESMIVLKSITSVPAPCISISFHT